MMDYDGENARQITHDRSLALSPTWAPWGNEISFTTFKRGNPDLYLFDMTRGASYPFSTPTLAAARRILSRWSSSSRQR